MLDVMRQPMPEKLEGLDIDKDTVRALMGVDGSEEVFISEAMVAAVHLRSLKDSTGNRSLEIIRDQIGQKPVEQTLPTTTAITQLAESLKQNPTLMEQLPPEGHHDDIP